MSKVNLSDILELPASERLRLVQAVWDSIAEAPEALLLTEAERRLLDQQLDAYHPNPNEGSPWAEVKARPLKRR